MENFMTSDITVIKTEACCKVTKGTPVHKNRPSHGLVFYVDGKCIFTFSDGKTLTASKNKVLYLPKGSDYVVERAEEGPCYAINFQMNENAFSPFAVIVKNEKLFLDAFRNADMCFKSQRSGYSAKCKAYIYDIISALQYEYSLGYISGEKKEIIARATDYIHENYTDNPPSVSFLAELCGITPEYLRTLFRQQYGVSPVKYINNLRISRSAELLCTGLYSVSEVALMSGFSDAGYFSRDFKKIMGVSPAKYMENANVFDEMNLKKRGI